MHKSPAFDDALGLDTGILERMLSVGGPSLRRALIAQLVEDFERISRSLHADDPVLLSRAAHELKGLSATIGAAALADHAARFDSLVESCTAAVRQAMTLGLRRQIERLIVALRARDQSSTAA